MRFHELVQVPGLPAVVRRGHAAGGARPAADRLAPRPSRPVGRVARRPARDPVGVLLVAGAHQPGRLVRAGHRARGGRRPRRAARRVRPVAAVHHDDRQRRDVAGQDGPADRRALPRPRRPRRPGRPGARGDGADPQVGAAHHRQRRDPVPPPHPRPRRPAAQPVRRRPLAAAAARAARACAPARRPSRSTTCDACCCSPSTASPPACRTPADAGPTNGRAGRAGPSVRHGPSGRSVRCGCGPGRGRGRRACRRRARRTASGRRRRRARSRRAGSTRRAAGRR